MDRRLGERYLSKALDRVIAMPGARYVEDSTGTNSLATAYDLQKNLLPSTARALSRIAGSVLLLRFPHHGSGHAPGEGVLDVTGPVLGPFVRRAARGIEVRLIEGARVADPVTAGDLP